MTKDEGCAIYAVARSSLFDDWRRYLQLTFYLVVFVKPTLKFGFQVYRQFVCEEGFQDFCGGPILIANYILISPQFRK